MQSMLNKSSKVALSIFQLKSLISLHLQSLITISVEYMVVYGQREFRLVLKHTGYLLRRASGAL